MKQPPIIPKAVLARIADEALSLAAWCIVSVRAGADADEQARYGFFDPIETWHKVWQRAKAAGPTAHVAPTILTLNRAELERAVAATGEPPRFLIKAAGVHGKCDALLGRGECPNDAQLRVTMGGMPAQLCAECAEKLHKHGLVDGS